VRISNYFPRIVARPEFLSDQFIEAELLGSRNLYCAIQRRIQGDSAHCTRDIISRHGLKEHRRHANLITLGCAIGDTPNELEELRRSDNRVRDRTFLDEFLLSDLRAEVAALWKSVDPNNRHRNVMPHACSRFVG